MTYRDNIRMDRDDIPVYQLMRAAEQRKQAEPSTLWPWLLVWAGVSGIVYMMMMEVLA